MPKSAPKKKKRHGSYSSLMVTVSLTLALGIIGLLGAILIHGGRLSSYLKEHVELHVYLRHNISESARLKVETILTNQPYVRQEDGKPQLTYISKEKAYKEFIAQGHEDFAPILEDINPLKPSFVIGIAPEYTPLEKLKGVKSEIEKLPEISEVAFNEQMEMDLQSIQHNIGKITLFLLIFASLALGIILALMNNTIRLALYSQRFLIRSMQLVGATPAFIRRPFLKRALIQGFLSGLVASTLTFIAIQALYSQIPDLKDVLVSQNIFILLGALPLVGAAVAFFSSNWAVGRYLSMTLDELY